MTKNARFSQKSKKHTQKLKTLNIFFDGFKNHLFVSPKEARYYFLYRKRTYYYKDVFEREEKEETVFIDTQSRVWNGRGFYFSFVFEFFFLCGGERNAKTSSFLGR